MDNTLIIVLAIAAAGALYLFSKRGESAQPNDMGMVDTADPPSTAVSQGFSGSEPQPRALSSGMSSIANSTESVRSRTGGYTFKGAVDPVLSDLLAQGGNIFARATQPVPKFTPLGQPTTTRGRSFS